MDANETQHSTVSGVPRTSNVLRWLTLSFLFLGSIGLVDATYLFIRHFSVTPGACLLGEGCNNVLASVYSTFHGVPVAFFGVAYYFGIVLLASLALYTREGRWMRAACIFTIVGFIASAWFVYLQLFVIREICAYCMASAATSTLLFIGGVVAVSKVWKRSEESI